MSSSLSEPIHGRQPDAGGLVEPSSLVWAIGLRKAYGYF